MIEAIPISVWHDIYQVCQGELVLAELDARGWRKTTLVVGDERYRLYREGFFRGAFVLGQERSVLARAVKTGWAKDDYNLEIGAGRLTLHRTSIKDRRFGVFDGEREVGSICRGNPDSRRTQIELPDQWPLIEQIFVLWLALVVWIREEAYERA